MPIQCGSPILAHSLSLVKGENYSGEWRVDSSQFSILTCLQRFFLPAGICQGQGGGKAAGFGKGGGLFVGAQESACAVAVKVPGVQFK